MSFSNRYYKPILQHLDEEIFSLIGQMKTEAESSYYYAHGHTAHQRQT